MIRKEKNKIKKIYKIFFILMIIFFVLMILSLPLIGMPQYSMQIRSTWVYFCSFAIAFTFGVIISGIKLDNYRRKLNVVRIYRIFFNGIRECSKEKPNLIKIKNYIKTLESIKGTSIYHLKYYLIGFCLKHEFDSIDVQSKNNFELSDIFLDKIDKLIL